MGELEGSKLEPFVAVTDAASDPSNVDESGSSSLSSSSLPIIRFNALKEIRYRRERCSFCLIIGSPRPWMFSWQ